MSKYTSDSLLDQLNISVNEAVNATNAKYLGECKKATKQADAARRKSILFRYIGQDVELKQATLKANDPLRGRSGRLLDVKRTRVLVGFPTEKTDCGKPILEEWLLPLTFILLPGSIESAPGQRELFGVEALDPIEA